MDPLLPRPMALPSPPQPYRNGCRRVETPETVTESSAVASAARLLTRSGRSSAATATPPTIALTPASPVTQTTLSPTQATERAAGALPLLHLDPPNLLQATLFLNQNTTTAGGMGHSSLRQCSATLVNRATGGLSSPGESLAHPSLDDKAELTMGEVLDSDHLPITAEPFARWLRDVLSKCAVRVQINGERGDSALLRQGLPWCIMVCAAVSTIH